MDIKDFKDLFENSPALMIVMDTDFKIVSVTDAYLKAINTKRENILGSTIFDVFQHNPEYKNADAVANMKASFNRVILNKSADTLPIVKYDIPKPKSKAPGFEVRYWKPINSPILDANNNVKYIIQRAEDVTDNKTLVDQLKAEQNSLQQIKANEKRYNTVLMQSPFAFCIMKGKDKIITLANDLMKDFWGKGSDVEGKFLLKILPELKGQPFPKMIDKVFKTGVPIYANEILARKKTDNPEGCYLNISYQPYYEADETISGVIIIAYDVTGPVIARKKAEDSEHRYRMLIEEATVATALYVGPEFHVQYANDMMMYYWGKDKKYIGQPLVQIIPEIVGQPLLAYLKNVYSTGNPYTGVEEQADLIVNGVLQTFYFNFTYKALKNKEGNIYCIHHMAVDVTAQVLAKKALEETESNLWQLLDSMPQKITTADAYGNVTYYNKQWSLDTGFSFEELNAWAWGKVIHPEDIEKTITCWKESIVNGNIFETETRFLSTDGEYKWHLNRAIALKDENGKIKMWVGTNTNIHQQKEAKIKAEIATQLAEDAVKSKQQFLSNMSHEIRTPMNAIIGFTNVTLKTDLNKKQKEYLSAIKLSGETLIVLINDILDLAKVESGKMTFEQIPFNLCTSISTMLYLFETKIQEKNLEMLTDFDPAIPEVLVGDPIRLRQIILNLVSNAVKFTSDGKITVKMRVFKKEAKKVSIQFIIQDTGIGIPQNQLAYIFDNFRQAANETSRLYGGTGLGLSIVKQLVELQGGTISVESDVDKGSTFSFILSFEKTKAKIEVETPHGLFLESGLKNIKVLVVEDIVLNQLLMKTVLKEFGFEMDIADNGKIAIEKMKKNKYDIILMDLQMPEMNGFEATEYIRNKMNSQIPIIALSADVTTVDIEKCKALGMNDYISKPVDEKLLYNRISKYVKKSELAKPILN